MVTEAVSRFGKIDILVNNAGVILHKAVVPLPGMTSVRTESRISDQEWLSLIATNLNGTFYCIRAVGPHFVKQNYGKIIIISSVLGRRVRTSPTVIALTESSGAHEGSSARASATAA